MDLWADFDNQQTGNLEESARLRQKQGTSRLTQPVVLAALRDWLLHEYVAAYCRLLCGMPIYRRCYWIDALGFEASTQSIMLRPITALSKTLRDEYPTHPLMLHGLLLAAEHHCKEIPAGETVTLPKESGIVAASWANAAPEILKRIDQSPAIFLLNPFGQTLYSLDLLAPIYQRTTAPTELCLLVPHKQAVSHLLASSRVPDKAAKLTELLRSDRWKMLLAKQVDAASSISNKGSIVEGLLDLLAASLRKHFAFVQYFALTMPTRSTLVETVSYSLLFATRRKDSLISMNDALCFHRRRVEEESCRDVLGEAWFAARRQAHLAEEMQSLYEEILRRGRIGHIQHWPDLRQHVLLTHFGQFSISEYDAILCQLISEGQVRCQWRQKRETKEKKTPVFETIPGADDVLLWE
jgi:hypothetical protein